MNLYVDVEIEKKRNFRKFECFKLIWKQKERLKLQIENFEH